MWYSLKVALEQLSNTICTKGLLQIVPKSCQADSENTHGPDGPRQRICTYYTGAQKTTDKAPSIHEKHFSGIVKARMDVKDYTELPRRAHGCKTLSKSPKHTKRVY